MNSDAEQARSIDELLDTRRWCTAIVVGRGGIAAAMRTWLAKQNTSVIVAEIAAVRVLAAHGIRPTFVTCSRMDDDWLSDVGPEQRSSTLVYDRAIDRAAAEQWNGPRFFFEQRGRIATSFMVATSLAKKIGAREVKTLGHT